MIATYYKACRITIPEMQKYIQFSESGMQFTDITDAKLTNPNSRKWDNFPLVF